MKKGLLLSSILLSSLTTTSFAITCPTLSADDVKSVINSGRISTDGWTLVDESGDTPDEIKANEPTANPWDEYYVMKKVMYFNNVAYLVGVGNILGGSQEEARERAEKIMLTGEESFTGQEINDHSCIYKTVSASQENSSYPFKTHYEDASLLVIGRHHADEHGK
jgi:hypothetical protein